MIKAAILSKKPNLDIKKDKSTIKASSKSINKCKELFSIEAIDEAMKSMGLKYKSLSEIEVYNLISYLLNSVKEKR